MPSALQGSQASPHLQHLVVYRHHVGLTKSLHGHVLEVNCAIFRLAVIAVTGKQYIGRRIVFCVPLCRLPRSLAAFAQEEIRSGARAPTH